MRLPANCPFRGVPPDIHLWREDLSGCCRRWLLLNEEPLCGTISSEVEVYRFFWRSGFDRDAVVRIGRQDRAVTLRWGWSRFRRPSPDDAPAEVALSPADWARFFDGLIAAKFWALDPVEEAWGLDGADWLIEGRRGNVYRGIKRWSPEGAVYDLGRQFFTLAGPPLSQIKLY
jgi:hypothetical protein